MFSIFFYAASRRWFSIIISLKLGKLIIIVLQAKKFSAMR